MERAAQDHDADSREGSWLTLPAERPDPPGHQQRRDDSQAEHQLMYGKEHCYEVRNVGV